MTSETQVIALRQRLIDLQAVLHLERGRFKSIEQCGANLLRVESLEEFATSLLESTLGIFEFEVGLLLQVTCQGTVQVLGQLGFGQPVPDELPFDPGWVGGMEAAFLLDASSPLVKAWNLDLATVIVCPLYTERGDHLDGLVVGGVTSANGDDFEPISADAIPSFSVLGSQAGTLLSNFRLQAQLRETNRQLELYNLNLASTVLERTAELEAARHELQLKAESLEQAGRYKSAFLATMSHELRTPLNAILGYAQILLRDPQLNQRQLDAMQVIRLSGDHLLNLITDILDLSKIEAGKMELQLEEFPLAEALRCVTAIISIRAEQKGLRFHLDECGPLPAVVRADSRRLRQVLINLLVNAVKFTRCGQVRLRVEAPAYDEDQVVHFTISDTGIGMNEEQVGMLFQAFQQVGDQKQRAEGTGLGLAISKSLVTLMGGTITVDSCPGVGTVFEVRVPLPPGARPVDLSEASVRIESHQIIGYHGHARTILIVDDQEHNRSVLRNMLEPVGFIIHEADGGEAALRVLPGLAPDLMLTDVRMPGMSGPELVRTLRSQTNRKDLPVIAVSSGVFTEDRRIALDAGCQAFIPKPVAMDELYQEVKHQLAIDWKVHERQTRSGCGVVDVDTALGLAFPPETCREFIALAEDGRMVPLRERLNTLRTQHPGCEDFISRLLDAARQFDSDAIVDQLKPMITG